MAENEVLRRIQEAKKTKSLDLNSLRLATVPNDVKDIQRLRNINLYRNAFDSIPDELLQLNFLENLNMYRNLITDIPKEISQLSNLRILNLGSNKLTLINESLFDIVTLEELDLSNNAITILSPKIAQLKQLRDLKVFRNKLKNLPAEIGDLKTLKRLDISYNELVALPSEFANLTELQQLTLTENPLRFPPPDVVKRGRQAIQRYLKDDGTEARECEAVGAGLTGTIVGQTATFTITSKNKLSIPKQVGGDRYEVTLVFLPDQPLDSKEELKVSMNLSSPLLNIPAGLVAEHLNNNTNNVIETNEADDSIISKTEKKEGIETEKVENGVNEDSTKINGETVESHDAPLKPEQEVNGESIEGDKGQRAGPTEVIAEEKKEEAPVSPKHEPVVIPPLDLPTKRESKKSRPTSAAVSEKGLETKQLSTSSLLDDSVIRTKSNLETSLDVSALDSSVALDTSAALDTSNAIEAANGEKKSSRSKKSSRRREKSSDKTADKKKSSSRRKHKRDRSKKKSPRSPRSNNIEISHVTAETSSAVTSENNTPRQPSRSNLKASSDLGTKRTSIPHIERSLVQTAPAAIVQQKVQADLQKKKDERPDLTSQFVVTGNVIDNLDGTYVANYQPTLSGVYDMYVTLNGINIKASPFRISVDADLRSELTKLKELFWTQKKRADALQKELNETKITVSELTDWLKVEEKAKHDFEQQNIRLKNELTFLKQMAANMNPSQSAPGVVNTPKAKGKRRRSNRRSYHPSAISNFEESDNASQKGTKKHIPQVSASNDFDGIVRQKSAPNWKRNRPGGVRRENSEPVPNEPTTPSKPRYVPKKIEENVEQNTLENKNIDAGDLGSAVAVASPRKRNTVTINDEKSNNESIASNNNSKTEFQASAKKRKSDKRRTPAKNKRASMMLGEGGEEGDPKKSVFKEKLNFWRRIFDKKDKGEVNYVRKGSRASKSGQNKEDKKSNNNNDKAEPKVEEQSYEPW